MKRFLVLVPFFALLAIGCGAFAGQLRSAASIGKWLLVYAPIWTPMAWLAAWALRRSRTRRLDTQPAHSHL